MEDNLLIISDFYDIITNKDSNLSVSPFCYIDIDIIRTTYFNILKQEYIRVYCDNNIIVSKYNFMSTSELITNFNVYFRRDKILKLKNQCHIN